MPIAAIHFGRANAGVVLVVALFGIAFFGSLLTRLFARDVRHD
jgi:hypothetical protein